MYYNVPYIFGSVVTRHWQPAYLCRRDAGFIIAVHVIRAVIYIFPREYKTNHLLLSTSTCNSKNHISVAL